MKRIVFLDYVRVFACFLVMVVHASENFYGAEGSTDMVGPQSYLANEADRLWVAVYDGFSRMAVPLFIIVSAFLLAPMKAGLTSLAILLSALYPHLTAVFHIYDIIQHFTLAVGADRCRDIIERYIENILELSFTGWTFVVHVPFDQPLFIYTRNIAMVE